MVNPASGRMITEDTNLLAKLNIALVLLCKLKGNKNEYNFNG